MQIPSTKQASAVPDTSSPVGSYLGAWIGHASQPDLRESAASGGVATATLIHLLKTGRIRAALVCRMQFRDGEMIGEPFLAKTPEEIRSAQGSKYFDIALISGLNLIKEFEGPVAVVGLPSQISSFYRVMKAEPQLETKIKYRISVFCGHNSKKQLIEEVWRKRGILEARLKGFAFRKGSWRGKMHVETDDEKKESFPFQAFSDYQNLHILSLNRCLNCHDHMGYFADISTGDVWTRAAKKRPIKPSIFLARTSKGLEVIEEMIAEGVLDATAVDRRTVYRSQLRSINYHYNLSARARLAPFFGLKIQDRVSDQIRWRDLAGAFIVLLNHKISSKPRWLAIFMRLPRPLITCYLYLFKALMHYERESY